MSAKASAASGFVLRTLKEFGRAITTADFAYVVARDNRLGEDDARLRLNAWPSFLTNVAIYPIVSLNRWRC
ncbi:hypothetical protein ASG25_09375 [Rhizobium sp. Leaf384]|nr:hypothetical protein ASG25_09375 [Rhizobium sp. Leaf384]